MCIIECTSVIVLNTLDISARASMLHIAITRCTGCKSRMRAAHGSECELLRSAMTYALVAEERRRLGVTRLTISAGHGKLYRNHFIA